MKRRVVITGIGAVTPLGNTAEETWQALIAGKSGVGPLTRLDTEKFPAKVAAEVKDFDIEQYVEKRSKKNGPFHSLCTCFINYGSKRC